MLVKRRRLLAITPQAVDPSPPGAHAHYSLGRKLQTSVIDRQTADFFLSSVHDPDYRASLNDWNSIVEVLTEKLCNIDSTVPELPVKDLVRQPPALCMYYLGQP